MAISDELSRLITAKAGIKSALEEKGLTIGDSSTLDEFPTLILEMEVGGGGSDTSVLIDLIEGDITSLNIPEGTTKIGSYGLSSVGNIPVTYPSTLTTLEPLAFAYSNIEHIAIPETIKTIGTETCAYSNATSFSWPSNKSTIPFKTFYNGKLTKVVIPNTVTTLGNSAFNSCPIEDLVLGTGITDIPTSCFYIFKSKLNRVTCLGTTPPTVQNLGISMQNTTLLYVPAVALDSYKTAAYWTNVSTRIHPLAAINYDDTTYTVTASGRDNVELYVDASLINSSVYTFVPDTIDVSHNITVKSVDPSLGILDEVTLEILIEGETLELKNYMALTAVQNSSVIFLNSDNNVDLKYSSDGVNWSNMTFGSAGKLNLPAGETLYFKGNNQNPVTGLGAFNLTGKVDASGNVMSLIYDENFENQSTVPDYAFLSLFMNCSSLRSVENLLLPATTLGTNCYKSMFMSCSNITKAPELPALTLVSGCYVSMFDSCSKLNYIKAMFTTEPSDTYLRSWASGVAMEGTLVLNAAAEWDPKDYDMELGDIVLDWTIEKVNA